MPPAVTPSFHVQRVCLTTPAVSHTLSRDGRWCRPQGEATCTVVATETAIFVLDGVYTKKDATFSEVCLRLWPACPLRRPSAGVENVFSSKTGGLRSLPVSLYRCSLSRDASFCTKFSFILTFIYPFFNTVSIVSRGDVFYVLGKGIRIYLL